MPTKHFKKPLSVTHPELAKEADGWDTNEVTATSKLKKRWICSLGHSWLAQVDNRALRATRCPYCAGRKVLAGFNDLASKFPDVAAQAFGWDPSTCTSGTNSKKLWICSRNHKWLASVKSRTGKSTRGCPYCSGNLVLTGFNDLAYKFPDVAKEAEGWDPGLVLAISGTKKLWKCARNHTYEMTVSNRSYGHGCPYCSGRLVIPGVNDLATLRPDLANEAVEWDPTEVGPGSNRIKLWRCEFGHSWKSTIVDRSNGHGCPSCSKTGFDPNKKAFLYLLIQPDWELFQVGITNNLKRRLVEHKRLGWELLDTRGPLDGYQAREWETAILIMLKGNGADLQNKGIAGTYNGYSEAWSKSTFNVKSIKELMRLTEEFESK